LPGEEARLESATSNLHFRREGAAVALDSRPIDAITRSEMLRRSEVAKGLAVIADAVASRIMAADEIPRSVRKDVLRDIASLPLILEEVAHAQTRFPLPRGNGNHPEADQSEN